MSAYGDETESSEATLLLSTLNPVTDVLSLFVAASSKPCVSLRKRHCALSVCATRSMCFCVCVCVCVSSWRNMVVETCTVAGASTEAVLSNSANWEAPGGVQRWVWSDPCVLSTHVLM